MTQSKSGGTGNKNQSQSQSQNQQSGKPGALSEAEAVEKATGNKDNKSGGDHMSLKKAGSDQDVGGGAKQKQHRG